MIIDENHPLIAGNPKAYYLFLTSRQKMRPLDALAMVQEKFGTPKTPQQLAQEQAKQNQISGLMGVAGQVGGAWLGQNGLSSIFGGGSGAGSTTAAATGGGGAGGAGAGGATTTAPSMASAGAVALPLIAAAITGNSLYESGLKDIVRGKGKKDDYNNIGLAAATMGLSEVANIPLRLFGKRSIGRMMKTGKSDAQLNRDDFRGDLKEAGIVGDDWSVKLADGSSYNLGLDGKTKLKNVGENLDKKTERRTWDVDFSNPLAKYATTLIDPKIRSMYQGAKNPEQYTGMLVNAVTSNAKSEDDVRANIQAILGKSGFAPNVASQQANVRPKKGEVLRVSPGMYRTDSGRLQAGGSMREALNRAYRKGE